MGPRDYTRTMQSTRATKAPAKRKAAGDTRAPARQIPAPTVNRDMNVLEIASLHPDAADVLASYGLHCIGCAFSEFDSLLEGALAHGLTEEHVDEIVEELKHLIAHSPAKPKKISLTLEAGEALWELLEREGKSGWVLRVMSDPKSGFCMELSEEKLSGEHIFENPRVPDVAVVASDETLAKIGGATIDFREGRFKLDLPQSKHTCDCE